MRLNDLDNKNYAYSALKENFEFNFDVSSLDKSKTRTMLSKVSGLIKESRQTADFYRNQSNPAFMKLVFMEQALADHIRQLQSRPSPSIIIENEEVEKSQVVLAAQDMVDTVQKMLEDVGQMQVKELPALVSSIESEIGVNESQTYNDAVSGQLDALSAALKESSTALKNALNGLTGQAVDAAFDAGADLGAEAGMDAGLEADMAMPAEEPAAMPAEEPAEEPESGLTGGVGRMKR